MPCVLTGRGPLPVLKLSGPACAPLPFSLPFPMAISIALDRSPIWFIRTGREVGHTHCSCTRKKPSPSRISSEHGEVQGSELVQLYPNHHGEQKMLHHKIVLN